MSDPSTDMGDPACYGNEDLVKKVHAPMNVCDDQAMRGRNDRGDFGGTLMVASQQENESLKPDCTLNSSGGLAGS